MRIAFLTSAGRVQDLAFTLACARAPEHRWTRHVLDEPAARTAFAERCGDYDALASFLNPYVVTPTALAAIGPGPAFNVHPGTPEFPGQLPAHFAVYAGRWVAGATLHRMIAGVDAGEILDAWELPVDPIEGVRGVLEHSKQLALGVLVANLPALLDGSARPDGRTWRAGRRPTLSDFDRLARIDADVDAAELHRRVVAFSSPEHRTPYVELHGERFVHSPASTPPVHGPTSDASVRALAADEVRTAILEIVEPALATLGVVPGELADDFDLHLSGVVDSFGILELIGAVEERFGLEVDFEAIDPEDLTILGPFCRFVAEQSHRPAVER